MIFRRGTDGWPTDQASARNGGSGASVAALPGPGEVIDPVKSLAKTPRYLVIRVGWTIRNGQPHGHPRAGRMLSHGEVAPVAAVPRAVPRQAAHVIISNEPAPGVVVVAVGLPGLRRWRRSCLLLALWPTMPVPRARKGRVIGLSGTPAPRILRPRRRGDRSLSRRTSAGRLQAGRWAASTSGQKACGCGFVSPWFVTRSAHKDAITSVSATRVVPGIWCVRLEDSGQRVADVQGFVIKVQSDRLEEMVAAALDSLPDDLGRLMRNVAVTVEHDAGPRGLLGLYQGVPLTSRTSGYAGVLPDRIKIYRRAICAICDTEEEVVEQVRRTVIHEVAHHFGIDDARLDELGW